MPPLFVILILPNPAPACALPKPLCLLSHSGKGFPLPQDGREEVLKFFSLPEKALKISSDKKKDRDCIKARRENKWGRFPCKPQVSGDSRDAQLSCPGEETENSDPEVIDLPREQLTTAMNFQRRALGFPGFQVIAFPFCCPLKEMSGKEFLQCRISSSDTNHNRTFPSSENSPCRFSGTAGNQWLH